MNSAKLDPLDEAGKLLLFLAIAQARIAVDNPDGMTLGRVKCAAVLTRVRKLLAEVPQGKDPHKFMAAKTALEVLEAIEQGKAVVGGIDVFRGFVEAVHGGPRNLDFGGRRVSRKPPVEEAFLKAAAIVLWDRFPDQREKLATEARRFLGIRNLKALRKMVDNFNQRHNFDLAASESPSSVHIPIVTDLIDNHGYRTLS